MANKYLEKLAYYGEDTGPGYKSTAAMGGLAGMAAGGRVGERVGKVTRGLVHERVGKMQNKLNQRFANDVKDTRKVYRRAKGIAGIKDQLSKVLGTKAQKFEAKSSKLTQLGSKLGDQVVDKARGKGRLIGAGLGIAAGLGVKAWREGKNND
jgi:hypothetical protein